MAVRRWPVAARPAARHPLRGLHLFGARRAQVCGRLLQLTQELRKTTQEILEIRRRWAAFGSAGSSLDPARNQGFQTLEERAPLLRVLEDYLKELQRIDTDQATDIDDMPQLEVQLAAEQAAQVGAAAVLQETSFDLAAAHPGELDKVAESLSSANNFRLTTAHGRSVHFRRQM
jgi:hypothetical protein